MSPDDPAASAPAASPLLAVAIEAVRKAGEIQLAHLESGVRVHRKGLADVVTDADLEVEAMFRDMIAARFPGHVVLAEEMANDVAAGRAASHVWLFDPIDGTANYAHGVPFFCASLALEIDGRIEVAAVYEPSRHELFTAERGRGAWLNGHRLAVSATDRMADAMLGAGFPHGATTRDGAMVDAWVEGGLRARAIRRFGSAALDLCYVACGRLDGFWDKGLKAWDLAAGALIVSEAGGVVTALDGGAFSCHSGEVLASNGRWHAELVELMRHS
jgi:myo-inositol-1(or 4)-monophosphatase